MCFVVEHITEEFCPLKPLLNFVGVDYKLFFCVSFSRVHPTCHNLSSTNGADVYDIYLIAAVNWFFNLPFSLVTFKKWWMSSTIINYL